MNKKMKKFDMESIIVIIMLIIFMMSLPLLIFIYIEERKKTIERVEVEKWLKTKGRGLK